MVRPGRLREGALDLIVNAGVWLGLGVVLAMSELFLPGFFSLLLGLAAVVVAGAIQLGWIDGWMTALTTWFVVSILLIVTLRNSLMRIFPGGTSTGSTDDDASAKGSICMAISDIATDGSTGQIMFRETSWQARAATRPIRKDSRVKLLTRDGLVWVVEHIDKDIPQ